jgi:hypothetical protein
MAEPGATDEDAKPAAAERARAIRSSVSALGQRALNKS